MRDLWRSALFGARHRYCWYGGPHDREMCKVLEEVCNKWEIHREFFFHSTSAQAGGLLFGAPGSILAQSRWLILVNGLRRSETANANVSQMLSVVKWGYIPGPPSRQSASALDYVGDEAFVLLSQDYCVGVL
jgi:hypothetical protein